MRVLRRRRRESKTDYRSRIELLKSNKTRLVVRKSNRYILAQFVTSKTAQDQVVVGCLSKELLNKGWPKELSGSLKSLPAAYLTGLMLAKKAKGKIDEAIVDIGLNRNVQKSRIYALVKGCVDGGIIIPCMKEALPSEEELEKQEKTKTLVSKIKEKI